MGGVSGSGGAVPFVARAARRWPEQGFVELGFTAPRAKVVRLPLELRSARGGRGIND